MKNPLSTFPLCPQVSLFALLTALLCFASLVPVQQQPALHHPDSNQRHPDSGYVIQPSPAKIIVHSSTAGAEPRTFPALEYADVGTAAWLETLNHGTAESIPNGPLSSPPIFPREMMSAPSIPAFSLVTGIYGSVFIHEFGHYQEAQSQGLNPEISLGIIRVTDANGDSSLYLGRTTYDRTPRNARREARLALAGMSSTRNCYRRLDKNIRAGIIKGSFSSLLAIIMRSDFSRYVAVNALKKNSDELDDVETYVHCTGEKKNFVYICAVLDLLFERHNLRYHWQRALGESPAPPSDRRPWGWAIRPQIFIRKDIGLAAGVGLTKSW